MYQVCRCDAAETAIWQPCGSIDAYRTSLVLRANKAVTHPTPLYQHLLANAGEYKMSEVSRKIESTGGACLTLQALLAPWPNWPSIVKLDSLYFLVAFYRLLLRCYGRATGSLLKGHGPYRSMGDRCRI